nr:hypothetical protein [Lachnospiraceae bacterium]
YAGFRQFNRNRLKKKGYPYKTGDYLNVGTINEDGTVNPIPPVEKRQQKEGFISSFISRNKNKKEKKSQDK